MIKVVSSAGIGATSLVAAYANPSTSGGRGGSSLTNLGGIAGSGTTSAQGGHAVPSAVHGKVRL